MVTYISVQHNLLIEFHYYSKHTNSPLNLLYGLESPTILPSERKPGFVGEAKLPRHLPLQLGKPHPHIPCKKLNGDWDRESFSNISIAGVMEIGFGLTFVVDVAPPRQIWHSHSVIFSCPLLYHRFHLACRFLFNTAEHKLLRLVNFTQEWQKSGRMSHKRSPLMFSRRKAHSLQPTEDIQIVVHNRKFLRWIRSSVINDPRKRKEPLVHRVCFPQHNPKTERPKQIHSVRILAKITDKSFNKLSKVMVAQLERSRCIAGKSSNGVKGKR